MSHYHTHLPCIHMILPPRDWLPLSGLRTSSRPDAGKGLRLFCEMLALSLLEFFSLHRLKESFAEIIWLCSSNHLHSSTWITSPYYYNLATYNLAWPAGDQGTLQPMLKFKCEGGLLAEFSFLQGRPTISYESLQLIG